MQSHNILAPVVRRINAGVLAGLCALVLAVAGWIAGMFIVAELKIGDLRSVLATTPASGQTVIVGIDQETLAAYGGWPIAREYCANVLNHLEAAGATRIYFDSSLATASQDESDAALQEALRHLGPDRIALPIVTLKGKPDTQGHVQSIEVTPLTKFSEHTSIVSADMPFDRDSRVRSIGRDSFGEVASQPTVAGWLASGRDAKPGVANIDYRIDIESIPVISFADIERNGASSEVFKHKAVVVGLVAERVTQPVLVPRYGQLERASFMALAAETLILDQEPTQARFWMVLTCAATCVVVLGLCLPRFGICTSGVLTMLSIALLFGFSIELQRRTNLVLPLALPIAASMFTYVGTLIATHPDFQTIRQAGKSLVDKVDYGLAKLFHSGVDSIITFSPDGRILTVNEAAERLFGVKADDVVGKPLATVLPDSADALLRSASGHQPGRLEATVNGKMGPGRHVDLAFNAMPSEAGWVGYASIRDITEMKAREDEFKRQATHDGMTGLPNRAAFERHLDATRRFAAETGSSFAVFMMDLNKFKQVNDTLGHHIGDALLMEVAKRFESSIRKGDFVARLGGDEFAVVVAPPTECDNAERLAAKLVDSIASLTELEGHAIETGTSIGIALYPEHAQSSADLVRVADEAMYEAKRGGRGFAIANAENLDAVTS
ncbi:MAG: diguanylate cyclase [Planctomycetaceae bacterium]|nr:diguanylate cyclase [Planctomycetales bacterium]MCB9874686.1 diguanylate cyclase [Planctomycetaceae bacterium]MCB9938393.1 diguanylate cyclase [Planctomycetaceae bacterium]